MTEQRTDYPARVTACRVIPERHTIKWFIGSKQVAMYISSCDELKVREDYKDRKELKELISKYEGSNMILYMPL